MLQICQALKSAFEFNLTPYLTGFPSRSKSSRLFSQCSAATTSLSNKKKRKKKYIRIQVQTSQYPLGRRYSILTYTVHKITHIELYASST